MSIEHDGIANQDDPQNDEETAANSQRQSRKRTRNPDDWKRSMKKRKLRRASGKNPANNVALCPINCRRKCSQKVDDNSRVTLFNSFYDKSYNEQQIFLFSCIKPFSCLQIRKGATKHHDLSFHYRIQINSEEMLICKRAFLKIFAVSNKRMQLLTIQIKEGMSISKTDERGTHQNRPKSISAEVKQLVKNHISSFPTSESHYSRSQNPYRRYLSPLLNIKKMYSLYLELHKLKPGDDHYVKESYYRNIFVTEFNIGFSSPKSDTCTTCDKKVDIDETIKQHHLEEVKLAAQEMKQDRDTANTQAGTIFMAFDLQQTLPLPKLTTSKAFYLRQLWFYNLGIHIVGHSRKPNGYMHTWTENEAGRGSEEILSCLFNIVTELDLKGETLLVWSDSCTGQNKNSFSISFWQWLVGCGRFKEVIHKFPVVGHSYMDCDRDFGLIEKLVRKHETVYLPQKYREIIRDSKTTNKFDVIEMANCFYDMKKLPTALGLSVLKRKNKDGEIFNLSESRCMKISQFGIVDYKKSFTENWKSVDIRLPRKTPSFNILSLLRDGTSKPIAQKKLDDIHQLLPYVPPQHHWFYTQLTAVE